MDRSLPQGPSTGQAASADFQNWIADLQQAMQDTGWTCDALATHWRVNRAYAWRLVSGERPWSVRRQLSLPDDLEGQLEAIRAKRFGRIVVTAPTTPQAAMESLLAGIAGLPAVLSLPHRATAPVKADLRPRAAQEGAA